MTLALPSAGYSIAAVSKLTGINCHVLRVWERRYGFLIPGRSKSGHRRYSPEQVAILREIAARTQTGQSIGTVVDEYQAAQRAPSTAESAWAMIPPPFASQTPTATTRIVDLLFQGDLLGVDTILDRIEEQMSPLEMVEGIIEPALVEIGERWFRRESSLYQENTAIGCLKVRINRLLDQARRANTILRRRILVGAVQGDWHEGGLLMVCLALELAGWRAIPLGTNMPIPEFRHAVDAWKPDALALSFVLSRNIKKRFSELATIKSVPVFVGGRSIVNHQSLARRSGLIPLTGPLSAAISQLVLDAEQWRNTHPRGLVDGRTNLVFRGAATAQPL